MANGFGLVLYFDLFLTTTNFCIFLFSKELSQCKIRAIKSKFDNIWNLESYLRVLKAFQNRTCKLESSVEKNVNKLFDRARYE